MDPKDHDFIPGELVVLSPAFRESFIGAPTPVNGMRSGHPVIVKVGTDPETGYVEFEECDGKWSANLFERLELA